MSRARDIARKSVRTDMAGVSNAQAKRLLAEFGHIASMIASDYPSLEHTELEAIGHVAIMEAAATHSPTRIPLKAWITTVIRWRVAERAESELSRREVATDPAPERPTNGRHDPERTFELEQVLELLPYLPPRQAAIIDGRLRRETFDEIGSSLGISGAWCHEEYRKAISTIRRWLGFRV